MVLWGWFQKNIKRSLRKTVLISGLSQSDFNFKKFTWSGILPEVSLSTFRRFQKRSERPSTFWTGRGLRRLQWQKFAKVCHRCLQAEALSIAPAGDTFFVPMPCHVSSTWALVCRFPWSRNLKFFRSPPKDPACLRYGPSALLLAATSCPHVACSSCLT